MPLPDWLGRFNRVVTNRVSRPVAGHLPGFGIVVHEGRRSGRSYCTPVNLFRHDDGFTVALTYGRDAQWVRNVLVAGQAEITTRGRTHAVSSPRVVLDTDHALVPRPIRPILQLLRVDQFLVLSETP
jgi:deazaflavin-dependent oxidoreductase (nitroreductase family)